MAGRFWRVLEIAVRVTLGGLFVYAGALKALNPLEFLESIRSFQILGDPWAPLTAMFLPWLEIAVGLGVLLGKLYRGALAILGGMLVVFLAGILSAWARGLDIDCGCFGGKSKDGVQYWNLVLRDMVMLGMTAWLWVREWGREREEKRGVGNVASPEADLA